MKFKLVEAADSKICCICKKPFDGYGNNAEPVCSGSCCDECNMKEVNPARLKMLDDSSSEDLDEAKADDILPGQISIFDNFRKFVELEQFRKSWKAQGLTDDDIRDLQNEILNNPEAAINLGDNVYKIRFAPRSLNKGKSGSYRVFYVDAIVSETIYLLDIISKSDRSNISSTQLDSMRDVASNLKRKV